MRTSVLLLAVAALLVTASTATAAQGDGRDGFPSFSDDGPRHGLPAEATLALTATGSARERNGQNATFTLQIDAKGRALEGMHMNATDPSNIRGFLYAHVSLAGVNHTRDGRVILFVYLHQANGAWQWYLDSRARSDYGVPRIGLRGTATSDGAGGYTLTGEGRILRLEDGAGAPLKLTVTSGQFTVKQPPVYAVNLTGSGTTPQNQTDAFSLSGSGATVVRERNGTAAGLEGWMRVHVQVTGGNGTVLKDRSFWLHFNAVHLQGNGLWMAYSAADRANGLPRIMLHGTITGSGGSYQLTGKGSALFWDGHRLPLKLTVSGTLSAQ